MEINAKLDLIIANQRAIFDELEDIKLIIQQQPRDNAITDMEALWNNATIALMPGAAEGRQGQLNSMLNQAEQLTSKLGQYDLGAFPAFVTTACIAFMLQRKLKSARQPIATFEKQCKGYVDGWLGPRKGGVQQAIANATNDRENNLAYMKERAQSYYLPGERNGDCGRSRQVIVTGDFEKGYTGSLVLSDWNCLPERRHPNSAGNTKLQAYRAGTDDHLEVILPPDPNQTAPNDIPKPTIGGSGFERVDQANAARNGAIVAMIGLRKLSIIKDQLEQLSIMFAG